jgi:PucR C-terminal helix-turn-helix domain/GGDEF-like domain
MSPRRLDEPVDLDDLVHRGALRAAEVVHLPDGSRQVEHVVLAQSLDRIRRVAPHTLVVLAGEAATGGWTLAAGLRVAWERNAAAVIAPRAATSPSAALLADRLGIALLVSGEDLVDLALVLAAEVSRPDAVRALRVAACAKRLARQTTVRGVLAVLNEEIEDVDVALVVGEAMLAGRAAALRIDSRHVRVTVEVPGVGGRPWAHLVAALPTRMAGLAEHVRTLLVLARAPLTAASARAQLDDARRTTREQAALRLLRRVAADSPAGAATDAPPEWTSDLGWRLAGTNVAVWVAHPEVAAEPPPDLTAVVRAAWAEVVPGWALVADSGGWVSWANAVPGASAPDVPRALRARFERRARELGLVAGVGLPHEGVVGLLRSAEEARIAARVALTRGAGALEAFDRLGVRAVLAGLPDEQTLAVAQLTYPALMATRDRALLVSTVLAVLDCGGSLSQAAARLRVHRNTVLARLSRARELGLDVDDPRQHLALHLMCYTLSMHWQESDGAAAGGRDAGEGAPGPLRSNQGRPRRTGDGPAVRPRRRSGATRSAG